MKRWGLFVVLAAALSTTACDEEKRAGQLTLAGTAPLRIVDKNGSAVEFQTGPLTVEFDAKGGGRVAVTLDQSGRKAEFEAKVPRRADWNFSLKGRDIGQPADIASARKVELYGPRERRIGNGGPCGFNGTYTTEEIWQKGNEDWTVSFADAQSAAPVASFKSRREGEDFLVETHNLWCRERPERHPGGGRWDRVSEKLKKLEPTQVKFD